MHEIQKADPRARRWAVLFVSCGILAGLVVIWLAEWGGPALEAWLNRDPEHVGSRLGLAVALLALAVALPVLGVAGYFWRLGDKIRRTDRFPAPGTLVMRDTMVLRGAPAPPRTRDAADRRVAGGDSLRVHGRPMASCLVAGSTSILTGDWSRGNDERQYAARGSEQPRLAQVATFEYTPGGTMRKTCTGSETFLSWCSPVSSST